MRDKRIDDEGYEERKDELQYSPIGYTERNEMLSVELVQDSKEADSGGLTATLVSGNFRIVDASQSSD